MVISVYGQIGAGAAWGLIATAKSHGYGTYAELQQNFYYTRNVYPTSVKVRLTVGNTYIDDVNRRGAK